MKLTIVVDNYSNPEKPELLSDWGLSIYINAYGKNILFDTGRSIEVFRNNVERLNIDLTKLDYIIISHEHGDHTGSLRYVGEVCKEKKILYLPSPSKLADKLKKYFEVYEVKDDLVIHSKIHITYFGTSFIPEQSLVIELNDSLIMIVGCSHPGIVNMVNYVVNKFRKRIKLLIGGFHLFPVGDIEEIVRKLIEFNIEKICPIHCSGDTIRNYLQLKYPNNYLNGYVGVEIEF